MKTMCENESDGQIHTECFLNSKQVLGRWGFQETIPRGPTFACNKKGGMNEDELKKYLTQAIMPLYPDAADIPGKRVIIKIDSGPGRTNESMLAELRVKGFYLLPGLPNSTHVTQETDQNYGLFKHVLRKNLEKLTREMAAKRQRLQIPDMVWLVFGGTKDGITLDNAFEAAFNREHNKKCWKKVGTVPLTRNCLYHEDVSHFICYDKDGAIDVDADPETTKLVALEEINVSTCQFLTSHGFGGQHYLGQVPKNKTNKKTVTVPLSKERIEAMQKVSSAGQHFEATGGEVLNSDDFFISREKKKIDLEIAKLKNTKKLAAEHKKLGDEYIDDMVSMPEGKEPLEATKEVLEKDYTIKELKPMVAWKLLGKKVPGKKNELVEKWIEVRQKTGDPEGLVTWTQADGIELLNLETKTINIDDTELGRTRKRKAEELRTSVTTLEIEDLDKLSRALAEAYRTKNMAAAST
jgi:hypothetical protein